MENKKFEDRDYDAFPTGRVCECCFRPISRLTEILNEGRICDDCKELCDDL